MSPPAIGFICASREQIETRALIAIIWLSTVVYYLLIPHFLTTDDAMRLVQVRDLLSGQSWFDPTQYRLVPPDGLRMHWSRLIDIPLAALIRAGAMLLPIDRAEQVATIVWPAGLLLIFFAGVARLARQLADEVAVRLALIFAALTLPVLQFFRPGGIDHHNAQLVLLVWSLVLALRPRPRDTLLAGAACALSIAIGQDIAPAIAAVATTVAMRWSVLGESVKYPTAAFALAFAGFSFVLFVATVAPADYALQACDAFSIVQVTTIVIGGSGLALLTAVRSLTSPKRRLIGAAGLGALITAIIVLAFPACLGDPYMQVDPRLRTLWLNQVNEARSMITMLREIPQAVLPYYGLVIGGLAAGLYLCGRERDNARWTTIICVGVLATVSVMAFWQVRSAAAANAIALVLVPAALVRAHKMPGPRFLGLGRVALVVALIANPVSLIAIGAGAARAYDVAVGIQRPVATANGPGPCQRAADYAPLASLPRGLVIAFIDAGPFILMETPHDALAAPYHRNTTGNAAMYDIVLSPPHESSRLLESFGVAYLAFCAGSPERHIYATVAPDGLAGVLSRGDIPDFLERIPLDGTDLAVYRPRR